jgi:hypothetical protein
MFILSARKQLLQYTHFSTSTIMATWDITHLPCFGPSLDLDQTEIAAVLCVLAAIMREGVN